MTEAVTSTWWQRYHNAQNQPPSRRHVALIATLAVLLHVFPIGVVQFADFVTDMLVLLNMFESGEEQTSAWIGVGFVITSIAPVFLGALALWILSVNSLRGERRRAFKGGSGRCDVDQAFRTNVRSQFLISLRGTLHNLGNIDSDEMTVAFEDAGGTRQLGQTETAEPVPWTLAYEFCCPAKGKAFYELKILEPLTDPKFGFVSSKFETDFISAGRDPPSRRAPRNSSSRQRQFWAVDGISSESWPGLPDSNPYNVKWDVDDVIGLACDLANNQILISVNGDFSPPNGVVFELGQSPPEELYAAFSAGTGRVKYNFGEDGEFEYAPPSAEFLPLISASKAGAQAAASLPSFDLSRLQVLRGTVDITRKERKLCFEGGLGTVGYAFGCPAGRKAYYEIRISEIDRGCIICAQFGFTVTLQNHAEWAVGECSHSWAVDGYNCRRLAGPERKPALYNMKWKQGHVIGLACDLVNNQILVSVNGDFSPPNGLVFELGPSPPKDLYAAISLDGGEVGYNFGEDGEFEYAPPSAEFLPLLKAAGFQENEPAALATKKVALSPAVLRGPVAYSEICAFKQTVVFLGLSTLGYKISCPAGSKAYYELKVVHPLRKPAVGFVTEHFERSRNTAKTLGDDKYSWAVDGESGRTMHKGEQQVWMKWNANDVIGLACDLVNNQILVSVNGDFSPPNGVVFGLGPKSPEAVFAAFSAEGGEVSYNFGEDGEFEYAPPSAEFLPLIKAAGVSSEMKVARALRKFDADHLMQLETAAKYTPGDVLSVLRGEDNDVAISMRYNTIRFLGRLSVVAYKISCPAGSKAYYELKVVHPLRKPAVGFVTEHFERSRNTAKTLGDDKYSWAVDGESGRTMHKGEQQVWMKWNANDVIGLACDLVNNQILVSVNGDFSPPNGVVFGLGPKSPEAVFAAFSAEGGEVSYNFGEDGEFEYAPPSAEFLPLIKAVGARNKSLAVKIVQQFDQETRRLMEQRFFCDASSHISQLFGLPSLWGVFENDKKLVFQPFTMYGYKIGCPAGCKAYCEVKILPGVRDPLVGFVSKFGVNTLARQRYNNFEARVRAWHLAVDGLDDIVVGCVAFSPKKYDCMWNDNDVIGLACDLVNNQILVSVNGDFSPPNGALFELGPSPPEELFAAFSAEAGEMCYNFGEDGEFEYAPPSAEFLPLIRAAGVTTENEAAQYVQNFEDEKTVSALAQCPSYLMVLNSGSSGGHNRKRDSNLSSRVLGKLQSTYIAPMFDTRNRAVYLTFFDSLVVCKFSCPAGSKAYFELKVGDNRDLCAGFIGFEDDFSYNDWLVHESGYKLHKEKVERLDGFEDLHNWKRGDVIGLACDLVNNQILVSVNGDFSPPNGVVFELGSKPPEALFAAFKGEKHIYAHRCEEDTGWVQYNFGEDQAFSFQPPSAEFLSPMQAAATLCEEGTVQGFSSAEALHKERLMALADAEDRWQHLFTFYQSDDEQDRVFRVDRTQHTLEMINIHNFGSSSTFGYKFCCSSGFKAYYELKLISEPSDPRFGFATSKFKTSRYRHYIGDDKFSWSVDGENRRLLHNRQALASKGELRYLVSRTWQAGDVIGLACDLVNNQILVSVNGDFSPPNGVVFELGPSPPDELYAAFSFAEGKVSYNFGEDRKFEHSPPSAEFLPLIEAADNRPTEQLRAFLVQHDVDDAKLVRDRVLKGQTQAQQKLKMLIPWISFWVGLLVPVNLHTLYLGWECAQMQVRVAEAEARSNDAEARKALMDYKDALKEVDVACKDGDEAAFGKAQAKVSRLSRKVRRKGLDDLFALQTTAWLVQASFTASKALESGLESLPLSILTTSQLFARNLKPNELVIFNSSLALSTLSMAYGYFCACMQVHDGGGGSQRLNPLKGRQPAVFLALFVNVAWTLVAMGMCFGTSELGLARYVLPSVQLLLVGVFGLVFMLGFLCTLIYDYNSPKSRKQRRLYRQRRQLHIAAKEQTEGGESVSAVWKCWRAVKHGMANLLFLLVIFVGVVLGGLALSIESVPVDIALFVWPEVQRELRSETPSKRFSMYWMPFRIYPVVRRLLLLSLGIAAVAAQFTVFRVIVLCIGFGTDILAGGYLLWVTGERVQKKSSEASLKQKQEHSDGGSAEAADADKGEQSVQASASAREGPDSDLMRGSVQHGRNLAIGIDDKPGCPAAVRLDATVGFVPQGREPLALPQPEHILQHSFDSTAAAGQHEITIAPEPRIASEAEHRTETPCHLDEDTVFLLDAILIHAKEALARCKEDPTTAAKLLEPLDSLQRRAEDLKRQPLSDSQAKRIEELLEAYLPSHDAEKDDFGHAENVLLQGLHCLDISPSETVEVQEQPVHGCRLALALRESTWVTTPCFFGAVANCRFEHSYPVSPCDYFISHAWQDNGRRKVHMLRDFLFLQAFLGRALVVLPLLAAFFVPLGFGIHGRYPGFNEWILSGAIMAILVCILLWVLASMLGWMPRNLTPWALSTTTLWIDKLCINQESPQTQKEGVASFQTVLQNCQMMVAFVSPTYFSRMWCVFEIALFASRRPDKLLLLSLEWPSSLYPFKESKLSDEERNMLETFDCSRARCFKPMDRVTVLRAIRSEFGSIAEFEHYVRTVLPKVFEDSKKKYRTSMIDAAVNALDTAFGG